jgi:hypothetical protein
MGDIDYKNKKYEHEAAFGYIPENKELALIGARYVQGAVFDYEMCFILVDVEMYKFMQALSDHDIQLKRGSDLFYAVYTYPFESGVGEIDGQKVVYDDLQKEFKVSASLVVIKRIQIRILKEYLKAHGCTLVSDFDFEKMPYKRDGGVTYTLGVDFNHRVKVNFYFYHTVSHQEDLMCLHYSDATPKLPLTGYPNVVFKNNREDREFDTSYNKIAYENGLAKPIMQCKGTVVGYNIPLEYMELDFDFLMMSNAEILDITHDITIKARYLGNLDLICQGQRVKITIEDAESIAGCDFHCLDIHIKNVKMVKYCGFTECNIEIDNIEDMFMCDLSNSNLDIKNANGIITTKHYNSGRYNKHFIVMNNPKIISSEMSNVESWFPDLEENKTSSFHIY